MVNLLEKQVMIQSFLVTALNFRRYQKNISNQTVKHRKTRLRYFPDALSWDILHNVNPKLEVSGFDVAIIHVGVKGLLRTYQLNQLYPTKYITHSL